MARAETRPWPPPRGRDVRARVCFALCVDAEGVALYALARVVGRCDRRVAVLQLDCPELAVTRHMRRDESLEDFRRRAKVHVEAINHATRDIPGEEMRMHLCWGNYEGPHNHDVPLRDIIDMVFEARPAAISFEAANPRHEHEWAVFEDVSSCPTARR